MSQTLDAVAPKEPAPPPEAAGPSKVGVYTVGHRRLEIFAICLHLSLTAVIVWRVGHEVRSWREAGTALLWTFLGYLASDMISGLVHFAADNYGTPTMPIFGAFVRTFREHHLDPKAITRHDFIETNGDSCIISVWLLVLVAWLLPTAPGSTSTMAIQCFIVALCVGTLLTSQAHKWAHMESAPKAVRFVQSLRLIISRPHHQLHHRGKHDSHFCITTGWMNPILSTFGVYKLLARLLKMVGIHPTP